MRMLRTIAAAAALMLAGGCAADRTYAAALLLQVTGFDGVAPTEKQIACQRLGLDATDQTTQTFVMLDAYVRARGRVETLRPEAPATEPESPMFICPSCLGL